jgi:hypothetical protein
MKPGETPEMIGHSVATRHIGARPEAHLAPFELRVICQAEPVNENETVGIGI